MRLAGLPDSPSPPPEPTGSRPTPRPRPPRRPRSLSAGGLPHVRSCGRHREALPAPPGSEQRRCAGSDAVPPRRSNLPVLRVAGGHAGLLRGTPRPPQRPAAGPPAAAGGAGGRSQQGLAAGECPRSAQGRNVAQAATWRDPQTLTRIHVARNRVAAWGDRAVDRRSETCPLDARLRRRRAFTGKADSP